MHGSFGSGESDSPCAVCVPNFCEINVFLWRKRKNEGTFSGTFQLPDPTLVPSGSAALFWNTQFFRNGGTPTRVFLHLLFKGDFMNKRDQKLLDKQLWGGSSNPPHRGIIIGFITVFLVGIGVGDILSKTKQANTPQANTHYAAMNSFPNGKE